MMIRIIGVMVLLMGILAACGGGEVSAASSGCSGARCFISISRSNMNESFSIDLNRVNPSGEDPFEVEITFTIEKGKVEVTYPNNAGETVTINLEEGEPITVQETFDMDPAYILFRFDPSGTVENASVQVVKVSN